MRERVTVVVLCVCVCVCVSVFSILPSCAFRRPTRGISGYSAENAVKLKKPCHKETDSVDLVVYQVNQLSLGLHRLQITLFNHKMNAVCFLVTTYLQSAVFIIDTCQCGDPLRPSLL